MGEFENKSIFVSRGLGFLTIWVGLELSSASSVLEDNVAKVG